jgi:threonine dehydratase
MESREIFSIRDIWQARRRISGNIHRTPLVYSQKLSDLTGAEVHLKMECWQLCGCFKVRGALSKLSSMTADQLCRGIVTTSSGNHAIGVAYAAYQYGKIPTSIFMPENTDHTHIEKVKMWGGNCILTGSHYQESYEAAREFIVQNGGTYVHSHADVQVMAGQGTIGLEIVEDLPDLDAAVVPIGGGGMISGIGTALKSADKQIRLIGVEPEAAPAAYRSMRDGICCSTLTPEPSIADGLLSGVHEMTFTIFKELIERVELVNEPELKEAVRHFQRQEQLMVEPSAAIGLAALLHHIDDLAGKKIVLILTSRNIDTDLYNRIVL